MSWSPILSGDLATRAREAAMDVADVLRGRFPDAGPDLIGGCAGRALLFAYLADETQADADEDEAIRLLGSSVKGLAELAGHPAFFEGYVGTSWAVEHLAAGEGEDDANAQVDGQLTRLLVADDWDSSFDLISGVAGLAVYAVERVPRPS